MSNRVNLSIFITLIIIYIIAQFLIGTYDPKNSELHYDQPADIDFLYYGAIANQLFNDFPPENPSFAGEKLTQPFIHYYPVALLAKILNPYNSIRIFNLVYLIVFGLVLMRFFPTRYGLMLVFVFASSMPQVDFNALGIDLIARGFTHAPFFILIVLGLKSKNLMVRSVSLFLAPMINGYMMLVMLPVLFIYALIKKDQGHLIPLAASILGMLAAALLISSEVSSKPFYFIFTESFKFAPGEIWYHAIPVFILLFFFRNLLATLTLCAALVFGTFIHYNPFFPIFLVYFSGALFVSEAGFDDALRSNLSGAICALLAVSFIFAAFEKYDPSGGSYFVRSDPRHDGAIAWILENTESDDKFMAMTADEGQFSPVMQYRPVYLGFIGHISHLGIDWRDRYNKTVQLYGGGFTIKRLDYIYYGPIEKEYFPTARLNYKAVYRDSEVTVFRVK